MRKVYIGMSCGFLVGIMDIILIMYRLKDVDVAIFSTVAWVVTGLIASTTTLRVHFLAKVILLRLLILSPSIILYLQFQQPSTLLFILGTSVVLGPLLGFFVDRLEW